jgi:hypothetical protein
MITGIPVQMYMSIPTYSDSELRECIQACSNCVYDCERCILALEVEDSKAHAACIKACRDCAAMCAMCIKIIERSSIIMLDMWEICVETCQACAEECTRLNLTTCDRCAAACRWCADVCMTLLAKAAA